MLQQSDWMLVYEAKPNDTDVSLAALFAPAAAISLGRMHRRLQHRWAAARVLPGPRCAYSARCADPDLQSPARSRANLHGAGAERRQRGRHHRRVPWRGRGRYLWDPSCPHADRHRRGHDVADGEGRPRSAGRWRGALTGQNQHVHDGERIDEQRAGNRHRPGSRSARTRSMACMRPFQRTRA